MKKLWEIIKNIFSWIWIIILLCIAIYFLTSLESNEYKTNIIGATLIALLAIRRGLVFFNVLRKGNPYFYFVIFIIAATFPPLFEVFAKNGQDSIEFMQFLIFYPIAIFLFVSFLGKKGKFGKKMQESIKKSEEKSKQKNDKRVRQKDIEIVKNKAKQEEYLLLKEQHQKQDKSDQKSSIVYCKNCGDSSNNTLTLVINKCKIGKKIGQKHIAYDGPIKDKYTCKHCGRSFPSIKSMIITKSCKSSDKHHEPNVFI
ncbi:MAG: hypothetical protein K0B10_14175 [Vicingaceae bacterium]|nr:hypothetical protein [Vicingaceae bacterium]